MHCGTVIWLPLFNSNTLIFQNVILIMVMVVEVMRWVAQQLQDKNWEMIQTSKLLLFQKRIWFTLSLMGAWRDELETLSKV